LRASILDFTALKENDRWGFPYLFLPPFDSLINHFPRPYNSALKEKPFKEPFGAGRIARHRIQKLFIQKPGTTTHILDKKEVM
jgi:hypothetical protein